MWNRNENEMACPTCHEKWKLGRPWMRDDILASCQRDDCPQKEQRARVTALRDGAEASRGPSRDKMMLDTLSAIDLAVAGIESRLDVLEDMWSGAKSIVSGLLGEDGSSGIEHMRSELVQQARSFARSALMEAWSNAAYSGFRAAVHDALVRVLEGTDGDPGEAADAVVEAVFEAYPGGHLTPVVPAIVDPPESSTPKTGAVKTSSKSDGRVPGAAAAKPK